MQTMINFYICILLIVATLVVKIAFAQLIDDFFKKSILSCIYGGKVTEFENTVL